MYYFVRGPLMWIAFIVFVGGIIFRIIQFFSLTRKKEEQVYSPSKKKEEMYGGYSAEEHKIHLLALLKNSIIGTYPVITIITAAFHALLFVIPIFLLAHSNLLHESWNIRLCSFSESTADILTAIFFGLALFFLVRRVVVLQVRAITTFNDYFVLLVTVAPFVTGFIAYHQWFDYSTVLTIHIMTGELMLMAVTFTKLGHMVFFFLSRFLIGREYCLGRGTRAW